MAAQSERFGPGSFANLLWVANKRVFERLEGADVEMTTNGDFEWLLADATGSVVKAVTAAGGGWTSIHLPSLGFHNFEGSLGFRNPGAGSKQLKDVVVRFG